MADLGDVKTTDAGRTEVSEGNRVDPSTNLYVPDSEKAIARWIHASIDTIS